MSDIPGQGGMRRGLKTLSSKRWGVLEARTDTPRGGRTREAELGGQEAPGPSSRTRCSYGVGISNGARCSTQKVMGKFVAGGSEAIRAAGQRRGIGM